jgi:hypothetical protein
MTWIHLDYSFRPSPQNIRDGRNFYMGNRLDTPSNTEQGPNRSITPP